MTWDMRGIEPPQLSEHGPTRPVTGVGARNPGAYPSHQGGLALPAVEYSHALQASLSLWVGWLYPSPDSTRSTPKHLPDGGSGPMHLGLSISAA